MTLDLALALLTAIICLFVAFTELGMNDPFKGVSNALTPGNELNASFWLFACTTLLPTLFYFLTFCVMMLTRLVIGIGKAFSLQWFEVATQDIPEDGDFDSGKKFKPWTMLGITAGLLVVILKFGMVVIG